MELLQRYNNVSKLHVTITLGDENVYCQYIILTINIMH